MNAEVVKDGIVWAWQHVRRDVFAMFFVCAGENVDDALKMAKALDDKIGDVEEAETTPAGGS